MRSGAVLRAPQQVLLPQRDSTGAGQSPRQAQRGAHCRIARPRRHRRRRAAGCRRAGIGGVRQVEAAAVAAAPRGRHQALEPQALRHSGKHHFQAVQVSDRVAAESPRHDASHHCIFAQEHGKVGATECITIPATNRSTSVTMRCRWSAVNVAVVSRPKRVTAVAAGGHLQQTRSGVAGAVPEAVRELIPAAALGPRPPRQGCHAHQVFWRWKHRLQAGNPLARLSKAMQL